MKKLGGAVAVLFSILLSSGPSWAAIFVGSGFGTACVQGGCPVFNGSVNAIGSHTLDLFQSQTGPIDTSSVQLIFAVPNNPANSLPTNPVTGAQLHVPGTNPASTPVTVGDLSPAIEMTHGEVYGALGLLDGNIVSFNALQAADYFLFPTVYDPTTNPIENFSLYVTLLTLAEPFAGLDVINVDFTSLPVGTFALGYATPSLTVTDTPFEEAGVSGLAAAVPEPSGLLLLGSALAGLRIWRRRRN